MGVGSREQGARSRSSFTIDSFTRELFTIDLFTIDSFTIVSFTSDATPLNACNGALTVPVLHSAGVRSKEQGARSRSTFTIDSFTGDLFTIDSFTRDSISFDLLSIDSFTIESFTSDLTAFSACHAGGPNSQLSGRLKHGAACREQEHFHH